MSQTVFVRWNRDHKCYLAYANNHMISGNFETREEVEQWAEESNYDLIYVDQFSYYLAKEKKIEVAEEDKFITDEEFKV